MTTTDGPMPKEAVRDLGIEIDRDAQRLANRVLQLAKIHDKHDKALHDADPEPDPLIPPTQESIP